MIYVSSSCVKHDKIKDSVIELAESGFKNIELSGGTKYYENLESDLISLQKKYGLNFMCHNYFPPPKTHFVLNLASLNDEVYLASIEHIKESILLSKKLKAKKFGFHAGFYIDIKISELGKQISKESLFDRNESMKRFCSAVKELQHIAGDLKLYIENNVFSSTNFKTYEGNNLFMLTNSKEYFSLKEKIEFNLLLDVAHLKVSSKTLTLNFHNELLKMIEHTDYIHISDNDGLHDLNHPLSNDSELLNLLDRCDLSNKNFTIEVYDTISNIQETYKILEKALHE